ncbi:MAG: sialidase family protein [Thermoguttaceae bacterium]|jgi:hypothetical protein|nr:sialidase family protein [Thermoguttaceae bacterium]
MRPTRFNRPALFCVAVVVLALSTSGGAATVEPTLQPGHEKSWCFARGSWRMENGLLEQEDADRGSVAILREPAFSDFTFSFEFNVKPAGSGVRAAAACFRATGTLTYYWLHLDTKNNSVILVRSTPENTWNEIARRSYQLNDDAWHQVTIACHGADITISVDGKAALTASDPTLTAGRVGVGTSQGQAAFRNLKIEGTVQDQPEALVDEKKHVPYRIISRGEAAGPYQAFPDACRLANGDIVAVFYAGYGHVSLTNDEWPKGGRICMVRSSDEGRTWSEPQIVYDDDIDNRDPHIAQMSDGTVICSFFSLKRVDRSVSPRGFKSQGVQIVCSRDGGRTWDPTARTLVPSGWVCSAPVREMPDGTYLLGVYRGHECGGVIRSTDKGKTWSEPIPIGEGAGLPLDAETDVILLNDGTLYAALRSSQINMHYATSPDLGLTWSPVKDIGFKGHAPHLYRLSTGEIVLTHRVPATSMHVSRDEAKTWLGPYQIDTVGGAYPATVELKDGTLLVVYYEEGAGSAVRIRRFRLQEDGLQTLGWD